MELAGSDVAYMWLEAGVDTQGFVNCGGGG